MGQAQWGRRCQQNVSNIESDTPPGYTVKYVPGTTTISFVNLVMRGFEAEVASRALKSSRPHTSVLIDANECTITQEFVKAFLRRSRARARFIVFTRQNSFAAPDVLSSIEKNFSTPEPRDIFDLADDISDAEGDELIVIDTTAK